MPSKSDLALMCLEKKYSLLSLPCFISSKSENLGSCSNSDTCHTHLLGWVALSTLQRAKRARLQKRVQAKTQDLWVQLLTLMKCLLCQSICLFILFVSGEFHLAHLSTLKLAASCSKLRNGEFMSTHWILTFNCIEISLFHSSLKHKNWQKTRPSVKTRSSF